MAKRILFFILLAILGVFIVIQSQKYIVDSFQNSSPSVNVPAVQPPVTPLGHGDPQPFTPPSTSLLSPPPGQTASVNSYPSTDPAQQPATLKRIKGVYETVSGFIKNEASGLDSIGNPAVQLP